MQCEFCLGHEGELKQVCLAVEALCGVHSAKNTLAHSSVLARNSHPNGADSWFTVVAMFT